jgi:hypothetical protein
MAEATTKPATDFYKLEIHSLANVFPPMGKQEYEAFKADIKDNGIRVPITLHEGKVLDGRNRYGAAKETHRLRSEDFTELPKGADPIKFVISANVARRHLSEAQRAMAAAKLANLQVGANQTNGKGVSIETASNLMNASKGTTKRCKKVLADGVPKLVELVEQDKIATSVAEEVAKLSKQEQAELVKKSASAIREWAKAKKDKEENSNSPAISDKVDKLQDAYIEALKELKEKKLENAEIAAEKLIGRLRDLDLVKKK